MVIPVHLVFFINFSYKISSGNKLNLTPIHWLSFWNESKWLKILLKKSIPSFIPSIDGVYPIDLAGKNNGGKADALQEPWLRYIEWVELLINDFLNTYSIYKNISVEDFAKDCRFDSVEELERFKIKSLKDVQRVQQVFILDPILHTHILYWSI